MPPILTPPPPPTLSPLPTFGSRVGHVTFGSRPWVRRAVSEALSSHKAAARRAFDEIERQQEAYSRAVAIFSEALKVTNPISMPWAAAAAAV